MGKDKFTSSQLDATINLLEKNRNKFYLYALMIIGFFILISIIPVSFLPKSGRISDSVDKSLNLIQSLGFLWWLILVGTMVTGFVWAVFADLKITKLGKDIIDKEIISEVFTVKEVVSSDRHNVHAIILKSPSVKKLVRNIDPRNINSFFIGQQFELKVLKHSHVLINELDKDFKLL